MKRKQLHNEEEEDDNESDWKPSSDSDSSDGSSSNNSEESSSSDDDGKTSYASEPESDQEDMLMEGARFINSSTHSSSSSSSLSTSSSATSSASPPSASAAFKLSPDVKNLFEKNKGTKQKQAHDRNNNTNKDIKRAKQIQKARKQARDELLSAPNLPVPFDFLHIAKQRIVHKWRAGRGLSRDVPKWMRHGLPIRGIPSLPWITFTKVTDQTAVLSPHTLLNKLANIDHSVSVIPIFLHLVFLDEPSGHGHANLLILQRKASISSSSSSSSSSPSSSSAVPLLSSSSEWQAYLFEPHGYYPRQKQMVEQLQATFNNMPIGGCPLGWIGPQSKEVRSRLHREFTFIGKYGKCLMWCMVFFHALIHHLSQRTPTSVESLFQKFSKNALSFLIQSYTTFVLTKLDDVRQKKVVLHSSSSSSSYHVRPFELLPLPFPPPPPPPSLVQQHRQLRKDAILVKLFTDEGKEARAWQVFYINDVASMNLSLFDFLILSLKTKEKQVDIDFLTHLNPFSDSSVSLQHDLPLLSEQHLTSMSCHGHTHVYGSGLPLPESWIKTILVKNFLVANTQKNGIKIACLKANIPPGWQNFHLYMKNRFCDGHSSSSPQPSTCKWFDQFWTQQDLNLSSSPSYTLEFEFQDQPTKTNIKVNFHDDKHLTFLNLLTPLLASSLIRQGRSYITCKVIDRPWYRAPSSWPRFTSLDDHHLIELAQNRVSTFLPLDGYCDIPSLTELGLLKHLLLVIACSKSRKILVTRAAKKQHVKVTADKEKKNGWLKTKEEQLPYIISQLSHSEEGKYTSVWHPPTLTHPFGEYQYQSRDTNLLAQALHDLDFEPILPAVLSSLRREEGGGDDQLLTRWDVLCPSYKIEYLQESKRESYLKQVDKFTSRGYYWISIQKSRDVPVGCDAIVYTKK